MTTHELTGNDVVCVPGQNLTDQERRVLFGLADGETPSEIRKAINADSSEILLIESAIRAKLGATSKPHMIARGFVLGVLLPRALCLLLASSAVIGGTDDLMRHRTPRTARSSHHSARLARTNMRGGSSRRA